MVVIILTACSEGLRGHLTQWLLEISAGVFVGHVNSKIRDRLWAKVIDMAGPGRALLVQQQPGEQRLSFRVHGHYWQPADLDGVTLIRRPTERKTYNPAARTGWSKASQRRRLARRSAFGAIEPKPVPKQSEENRGS